jgi:hypothetical protein
MARRRERAGQRTQESGRDAGQRRRWPAGVAALQAARTRRPDAEGVSWAKKRSGVPCTRPLGAKNRTSGRPSKAETPGFPFPSAPSPKRPPHPGLPAGRAPGLRAELIAAHSTARSPHRLGFLKPGPQPHLPAAPPRPAPPRPLGAPPRHRRPAPSSPVPAPQPRVGVSPSPRILQGRSLTFLGSWRQSWPRGIAGCYTTAPGSRRANSSPFPTPRSRLRASLLHKECSPQSTCFTGLVVTFLMHFW